MGVHVDVQGGLGYANFDLRPPVGDADAGSGAGFDVEDVADFGGELLEVVEVVPFVPGDALDRERHIGQQAGDDQGNDAKKSVLGDDQCNARLTRHGGVGDAAEVYVLHHPAQVLAGNGQRRLAGIVAGSNLVVGHHAVHEHVYRAVHGDEDDYAYHRNRHATGQEEQRVQRRPSAEREGELKAAGLASRRRHLYAGERFEHLARDDDRDRRPDHERQVDAAASHSGPPVSLPAM